MIAIKALFVLLAVGIVVATVSPVFGFMYAVWTATN